MAKRASSLKLRAEKEHAATVSNRRIFVACDEELASLEARKGRTVVDVRWNPDTGRLELVYA